jgi:hypothetical protein
MVGNRKERLLDELARQVNQDPDEIFSSASSCTLDEGTCSLRCETSII